MFSSLTRDMAGVTRNKTNCASFGKRVASPEIKLATQFVVRSRQLNFRVAQTDQNFPYMTT